MKKIIGFMLALIMVFAFTACNVQLLPSGDAELKLLYKQALESGFAGSYNEFVAYILERLDGLENENKTLAEKVEELEQQIAQQIDGIAESKNENKTLTERIADLEELIKQQTEEIAELKKEIENLKAKNEMLEILKYFDLSEPTDHWVGTIEDLMNGIDGVPARDDSVFIIYRKDATATPFHFKVEDFKFENIKAAEEGAFISDDRRAPEDQWLDGRRTCTIYLKETGYEKVLEAIEYFKTLEFIKCVYPRFS